MTQPGSGSSSGSRLCAAPRLTCGPFTMAGMATEWAAGIKAAPAARMRIALGSMALVRMVREEKATVSQNSLSTRRG